MDFLLAPDGGSARKARKLLAEQAPGLYRTAGTWPELMAQVEAAYQLTPCSDDWMESLMRAASRQSKAFWRPSLEVAPRETITELDDAIYRLLRSKAPNPDLAGLVDEIGGSPSA